jgi:hypothetical protein
MKNTLISLVAMTCFGIATAQSVQPTTTPGVLQQPRPSAAARADVRASDAYSAHQMQSRGSKMAVCRANAIEQHLTGIELRQSLLNCMK